MTKFDNILSPDPTWSCNESKDYLVTIGGVNFRMSEYAGASANGEATTKIILKSGKELIACEGFKSFIAYLHSQIEKFT